MHAKPPRARGLTWQRDALQRARPARRKRHANAAVVRVEQVQDAEHAAQRAARRLLFRVAGARVQHGGQGSAHAAGRECGRRVMERRRGALRLHRHEIQVRQRHHPLRSRDARSRGGRAQARHQRGGGGRHALDAFLKLLTRRLPEAVT